MVFGNRCLGQRDVRPDPDFAILYNSRRLLKFLYISVQLLNVSAFLNQNAIKIRDALGSATSV